jgi:hypothetical protein
MDAQTWEDLAFALDHASRWIDWKNVVYVSPLSSSA